MLAFVLVAALGVGCGVARLCGGLRGPPAEGPLDAAQLQDASLALAASPGDEPGHGGDVLDTRLEIDLSTHRALARIEALPSPDGTVVLEAAGLEVRAVAADGASAAYRHEGGMLSVVGLDASRPVRLTVEYSFCVRPDYQGEMRDGMVFTWPYYCGNLFPCHSHPTDGARFELELTGVSGGRRAVFPASIPSQAPAYMLAWAVGDYAFLDLGRTAAGTRVGVWYLPGHRDDAVSGSVHLRQAFDWLERTYGEYPYGDDVAGVEVPWPPGAYGGMEHHPYWHIAPGSLDHEPTQVHEAAHGWFGNGVRIRCWEDLVLSEGTASYVTARAIEAVVGPEAAASVWAGYEERLAGAMARCPIRVAWPASCGEIDVLEDGLFCSIPYMKGAFFFRALAARVGADAVDRALAAFYAEHRGRAAGMSDLLDTIREVTGYDPASCATAWLRSEPVPLERICPP
jgi:aminopeptidase N